MYKSNVNEANVFDAFISLFAVRILLTFVISDIYRFGDIFEKYLQIVKKSGVILFVVFDGFTLPAKASKNERR